MISHSKNTLLIIYLHKNKHINLNDRSSECVKKYSDLLEINWKFIILLCGNSKLLIAIFTLRYSKLHLIERLKGDGIKLKKTLS